MILVGAVFVAGPAGLLAKLTPQALDATFWIIVVFIYYILATMLPIDKIIGKIYPLFCCRFVVYGCGYCCHAVCAPSAITRVVGRFAEYQPSGSGIADLSDYVCKHSLRSYFGVSMLRRVR